MSAVPLPPRKPRGVGKDGTKLEGTIVAEILVALNKLPYCIAWRNNCGALKDELGRLVRYGIAPGSSDIIGIVRVAGYDDDGEPADFGVFVGFEVKRPGKERTTTADQRRFAETVHGYAAHAYVVTSAHDAVELAFDICRGAIRG